MNLKNSRSFYRLRFVTAVTAAYAAIGSAYATPNTSNTFTGGGSSTGAAIDATSSWTVAPTANTDELIAPGYPTGTANNTENLNNAVSFGSIDLTNTTQININGSNASNASTTILTLGGGGTNSVAPSGSDLFYAATGTYINFHLGGTSTTYGKMTIALAQSGNFDAVGTGDIYLNSLISGAYGITKTGTGYLSLQNTANTFTGGVNMAAGILQINTGGALGAAPGTAAVQVTFSGNSTMQFYSGATSASSNANIIGAVGATRTFSINTGITATFDTDGYNETLNNTITGAGSLTKIGVGTLTFNGSTCSYAGSTTINGGTIALNASTGLPTTPLVLGGGTLSLASGYKQNQNFSSTTLTALTSSAVSATAFNTAGLALSLGAINSPGGGVVDFTTPTTGSITTTNANVLGTGGQQTIMGGYATANNQTTWAVSGTGATAGAITPLATFDTGFATTGADVDVTTASNIASPVAVVNSLRFNTSNSFTITPSGSLTVAAGAILNTANTSTALNKITGGTLTSGTSSLTVIQNSSSGFFYIGSSITDSTTPVGLIKAGSGVLFLTGVNTFSGPTYVTAGTLNLQNQFALQYSTLAGGIVVFDQSVSNNSFSIGGISTPSTIALTNNNSTPIALTIGGNNQNTTYNNIFTGAGSLTKIGTGDTYLADPNSTFTGGFNISSGIVQFASGGSFGAAVTNVVTIQNGATIAYNGAGAATFGSTRGFTLGGGVDTIQIGSATTATNTSTSALTIGVVNVSGTGSLAGPATGTATLAKTGLGTLTLAGNNTYNGGTVVGEGTLTALSLNSLGISTVPSDTGSGPLAITPSIISATVNIESSTAGVSSLTNYVAGVPAAGVASLVLGSPVIGGATALTIGTDSTSTSYSGSISDRASNYSGAAGSILKVGTGTLTLSGSDTYTGGTNVSSGTLALGSSNALPVASALTIAAGATVSLVNHAALPVTVVQASTLSNSGLIDVVNNDLVVKGGGSTGYSTAYSQIKTAYNGGAWNGSSTTAGVITSSTAAADTAYLTAVGIATNLTSFEGLTVGTSDVLVKYTYYGDANLDGAVDGSDYTLIDAGFNGGLTGWQNGDFNYDGVVDGSDYTLIDNAFNTQGASLGVNPASLVASSTAQIAGGSSVPEPTSLGMIAFAAARILGRRRRVK